VRSEAMKKVKAGTYDTCLSRMSSEGHDERLPLMSSSLTSFHCVGEDGTIRA
jgi:hypothetical protein